jgi:hypothetical protein
MSIETINQSLLAVLDYQPDTIVPALARDVVSVSGWLVPGMSDGPIDIAMKAVLDLSAMAGKYGRPDIALDLGAVAELLRAELSENTRPNGSKVGEIYIDFATGTGSITCDGCSAADMADALITVAGELRMLGETPDYFGFDEGKMSVGQAGRDDHADFSSREGQVNGTV